ncbi:MAG: DUF4097 domain-containing protein [Clostridiales bacterium]|nr:DUF4097 domain-containing protein [Clostridiales bacterium]
MKTAKIISIICWLVTALILIGLVIWFLSGNLFGFRTGLKINMPSFHVGSFENLTGSFNAVSTYEAKVGDVDSLDIDWVSGTATLTPYDGDVVKIIEYAQRELADNEKFVCSVSGGTLEVKYHTPGWHTRSITKKLEVFVPMTLADKLDVLDLDATSAEVSISGFKTKTVFVKTVSGTADLSDISADTMDVSSISGTIKIKILTAAKLTTGSVSGKIELTGVTADNLKSGTTSGGQEFEGTFKDVETSSVSGEIYITGSVDPDRIFYHTTSGGITVTIPGSTDPVVSYSTVSGRYSSDIPLRIGNSGTYRFESVSGDIRLKAA